MSMISTSFLHQDEYWVTQDGQKIRLDLMTQRHLNNVLEMLRRRASGLKFHDDLSMCSMPMPGEWTHAFDDVSDAMDQQFNMPAREWLESTPLVYRLRVLTGEVSPNAHVPLSF